MILFDLNGGIQMTSTLSWTKYSPLEDETTILDPLAFDYFAQVLGNVVLPSFTTRTSRARYYSMVCYGIYISNQYLKKKGKNYYEEDVLEAFKLFERFWARAVVENYQGKLQERDGNERDFRGKRGAVKAYYENPKSLHYHFLTRQLELGGLGAYRTSLEDLELIKEDLSLTHKGMNLALNFVDSNIYDKLVLQAMNEERVIMKFGKGSLARFGFHGSLDGTVNEASASYFLQSHQEEVKLLKEYILDHPKNTVAITYIFRNQQAGNAMNIVEQIALQKPKTEEGKKVVWGFKTILAFEELAIIMNRIWCAIICTAEEHLGRPTIEEATIGCSEYLKTLLDGQYISILLEQKDYLSIAGSLHGPSFATLLDRFANLTENQYGTFLTELINYHSNVMKRRNSGSWMFLDGGNIIVTAGYDYPKKTEKLEFLHGYKISNILTLVKDTGWRPSDQVY